MADQKQIDNLVDMLDGYVEKGGHHLNVNVFGKEKLIDAMEHPEVSSAYNQSFRLCCKLH